MDQVEVYFLKMNNGENLLCTLVEDDSEHIRITQPYRVEMMQRNGLKNTIEGNVMIIK